jgi:hypothetical protein
MPTTVNGVELARDNSLQGSIDRLQHEVTAAEAVRIDARHAADRAISGAIDNHAVVALREHSEAITFRKPGANQDPDQERRLIGALCSEISQNSDLTLVPLGGSRFRVDDRGPYRKLAEAEAALKEAVAARDSFVQEHAEQIAAAALKAEADQTFAALKSGNRERILDALRIRASRAMTTADLSG